jgi:hypothetical protein
MTYELFDISTLNHTADHDPTIDHAECFVCAEALRRAFNRLADLDLGPKDVETLMRTIREEATA